MKNSPTCWHIKRWEEEEGGPPFFIIDRNIMWCHLIYLASCVLYWVFGRPPTSIQTVVDWEYFCQKLTRFFSSSYKVICQKLYNWKKRGGILCLISEKMQASANECIVLCYLLVTQDYSFMIDAKCRLKRVAS